MIAKIVKNNDNDNDDENFLHALCWCWLASRDILVARRIREIHRLLRIAPLPLALIADNISLTQAWMEFYRELLKD